MKKNSSTPAFYYVKKNTTIIVFDKISVNTRVPCNSQLFCVRTVTFDEQLEVTGPDSVKYRSADLMPHNI